VIAVAGGSPPEDEIAAIVAALNAGAPAEHSAAPRTEPSAWKMAGRTYDAWNDPCSTRF
jgi:hypothetical protein